LNSSPARTPPEFMNAATAPPKSVGAVASSIASAITSPIGCSPAVFVPDGLSRPERMSAVMLPTTRFASGADSAAYLSRIALASASWGTFCLTMTLVAVALYLLGLVVDHEVDVRHDAAERGS